MWHEGSVNSAKIILDIQIVVYQPNIVIFMHFCAFYQTLLFKETYSAFRLYIFCQHVCSLGIEPMTFYADSEMLYHWATGILSYLNKPYINGKLIYSAFRFKLKKWHYNIFISLFLFIYWHKCILLLSKDILLRVQTNIIFYFYFKLMLLFWILFPSNNPETKWINKKLFTHFQ